MKYLIFSFTRFGNEANQNFVESGGLESIFKYLNGNEIS